MPSATIESSDKYFQLGRDLAQEVYDEVSGWDGYPYRHEFLMALWAGLDSKFRKWADDEEERFQAGWDERYNAPDPEEGLVYNGD